MRNGLRTKLVIGVATVALIGSHVVGAAESEDEQPKPDISKLPPPAKTKEKIDFVKQVYPIFKEHCFECHGPKRQKGHDYRLDVKKVALRKHPKGEKPDPKVAPPIVPGKSAKSRLIWMVAGLYEDEDLRMPPPSKKPERGEPLTKEEIGILRAWIDQGAPWPDDATKQLEKIQQVAFQKKIKPILADCISCHGPEKQAGELRLDNREGALEGGWIYGPTIVPGDSEASPLIFITKGQDTQIPHLEKHKLSEDQVAVLADWIDQGAPWGESGDEAKSEEGESQESEKGQDP